MLELRLLFEKRGSAKYISHLDLMQVFRRAFARAGIKISFTEGFHPHPYINILLPLPTGFESCCELLDFNLNADKLPENFLYSINRALPSGINAVSVSPALRPAKLIKYAEYEIELDSTVTADELNELFTRDELIITKRTKRGESEVNIIPLVPEFKAAEKNGGLFICVKLAAGNENLNPEYILSAAEKYLNIPQPSAKYLRREVYDAELTPFR